MYQAFLVKYGEIGLKGSNRHIFENALKNRIMDSLRPLGEYTGMLLFCSRKFFHPPFKNLLF